MIWVNNTSVEKIERARKAIESLKTGRMIIVLDDEGRENEGDFIVPAQTIEFDQLNTMVRVGGGLVCVALHPNICEKLELTPQTSSTNLSLDNQATGNQTPSGNLLPEALQGTAFTISVDALEGVSTGISIADRLKTIKLLGDPGTRAQDLVRPGHIFPIRAREGGLSERRGHTEAAVQLALLSGYQPAAVICEILNADGTMARRKELEQLAHKLELALCTIDDLVLYLDNIKGKEQNEY